MKTLRTLVSISLFLLALLGMGMVMTHQSFPVESTHPLAKQYQEAATLRVLGTAILGLAIVLAMVSELSLVGNPRRLALGLSAANALIAVMAAMQQQAIWGSTVGWFLILIPLALAAGLAWAGLKGIDMEELAETLPIPEEVRRSWLRQIGEAAAQEERNRLARDLHDSIKQQIFTINVSTAAAQELWERDPDKAQGALADVRRSAREAMVEMQALLHQLTPRALTSAGLVEALREQCEALGYRTGAEVTLELGEGIPDDRLPPGAQETLFRIAQEALANVARHARARNVRVRLGQEGDWAVLRVRDDGQGFDLGTQTSGMGLRNLRERAESLQGVLKIHSAPGQGTALTVRLPLNAPTEAARVEKAALREDQNLISFGTLVLIFLMSHPANTSFQWVTYDSLFILGLLLTGGFWNWVRTRSALEASPGASLEAVSRLRLAAHRNRVLSLFLASWWAPWYWWLAEGWTKGRYAWLSIAVFCLFAFILDILNFHRASRFSNPFRSSFPTWNRIVLFLLIGLILLGALSWVFFLIYVSVIDPKDAQLMLQSLGRTFQPIPVKISFLATATAVLLYTLIRQPRTEGAPV